MTAVTLQHPLEQPASDLDTAEDPPTLELAEALNGNDNHSRKKHKKKAKEERRKRSRSYSTDASCCSTSSKKKKKKKKHHRRSLDEPPSPKVNPIFLWVKEDNAKIVEVRCEDYDRRNRIKLTKTPGGWRAIPHVEMEWQTPRTPEPLKLPKFETLHAPKLLPKVLLGTPCYSPIETNGRSVECFSRPDLEMAIRGETPPPQLVSCDKEEMMSDDGMEMESREMPPLEPETTLEVEVRKYALANVAKIVRADVDLNVSAVDDKKERAYVERRSQAAVEPKVLPLETNKPDVEPNEPDDQTIAAVIETNIPVVQTNNVAVVETNDPVVQTSEPIVESNVPVLEANVPSAGDVSADAGTSEPVEVEMNEPVEVVTNDSADVKTIKPAVIEIKKAEEEVEIKEPACIEHEGDHLTQNKHHDDEEPEKVQAKDEKCHEPPFVPKNVSLENKSDVQDSGVDEPEECAVKCCDESQANNVDENHNNEFDSDTPSSCMIEPSNFFQDVEEILGAIENNSEQNVGSSREHPAPESSTKEVDEYDHSALMSELEEMMNERMKHENAAHKDVLDDIYTFVPSPTNAAHEKPKPKENRPTSKIERVIEAVKAKSACAMMAKVNATSDERPKGSQPAHQLKTSELESLDLLWRLPEGTTIHHSKPTGEKELEPTPVQQSTSDPSTSATISLVKATTPTVTTPTAVPSLIPSGPVQEEPLNLGKPRRLSPPALMMPSFPPHLKKELPPPCKVETKPHLPLSHVPEPDLSHVKPVPKKAGRFTPDVSKPAEPLAQLKEIMSDPDVTVPDPLLVPKERLSALIANPKREIPRLMALTNEVKYPKLDTNLMEVSLAHLQLLLQSSKKEDELKLFQKHADLLQSHLKNDASALDPATMSALNQMLWLPYISHLDMGRGSNPQDIVSMMNMMYPYNAWGQQGYDYAQQSHLMSMWQDMAQKPNFTGSSHASKGYADLYKPIPPVIPPALYTSAPTMDSSRIAPTPSYPASRTSKHSSSRRHHRPGGSLPLGHRGSTPDFLKPPHFDMSWSLPQTSEAGRVSSAPSMKVPVSRPEMPLLPPTSAAHTPVSSAASVHSPKLKVRKFDVDPNAVPKLINKNLTAPPLPPLPPMAPQVPSHYYGSNHLWNPLYGAPETRESDYSTGHWNWTTPVTVSGK